MIYAINNNTSIKPTKNKILESSGFLIKAKASPSVHVSMIEIATPGSDRFVGLKIRLNAKAITTKYNITAPNNFILFLAFNLITCNIKYSFSSGFLSV